MLEEDRSCEVLVLGGGLAGIAAARNLAARGVDYLVVEQDAYVGGLAATDELDGFVFDRAPHFLHLRAPLFRDEISASNIGLIRHTRKCAVMIDDHAIPYPLQFNMWAAPERLRDALRVELLLPSRETVLDNLATYLESTWGCVLYGSFFEPFNRKLFGVPLHQLPADCLGRFVPQPDRNLIDQGLTSPKMAYGYNAEFMYPRTGRIGDVAKALASLLEKRVLTDTTVTKLSPTSRICTTTAGTIRYEKLVSTVPLDSLLRLLGHEKLDAYTSSPIGVLGIGVRGAGPPPWHWLYIPGQDVSFHRVNFTAEMNLDKDAIEGQSILVEYGSDFAPPRDLQSLAKEVIDYLVSIRAIGECRVDAVCWRRLSPGYVHHRAPERGAANQVKQYLKSDLGISVAGRYGEWDYHSMEDSFMSGWESINDMYGAS